MDLIRFLLRLIISILVIPLLLLRWVLEAGAWAMRWVMVGFDWLVTRLMFWDE